MWWLVLVACTETAELPPSPTEEVAPAAGDPAIAAPAEEPVPAAAEQPQACGLIFTEEHSNAYYAKLGAVAGEDGCKFDAVRTRSSTMGLEWKKGDTVVAWTLAPAACTPEATVTVSELALSADDAARAACPEKWERTVALMKSGELLAPRAP